MTFDDYQKEAVRTASNKNKLEVFTMGLCGEAGEVAELVKKHLGHDQPLDREQMVKELGDVLWYLSNLADLQGINLDEIAQRNVEKLRLRYPEGFSPAASVAKADEKPKTATQLNEERMDAQFRARLKAGGLAELVMLLLGPQPPAERLQCPCPFCTEARRQRAAGGVTPRADKPDAG
jgi:NTP pyrophosphatase (non-canonical NTP hydrolase)